MLVGAIRLAHGFWRGFLLLVFGVAFSLAVGVGGCCPGGLCCPTLTILGGWCLAWGVPEVHGKYF